jgi:hypothetical protein
MVQKCATINRPRIELLIEPHLIRDHVVGQTKRCGRFLDLPLNGTLSGESIAQLPGQSTVKVGAGKFGEGLVFKLSMGVSHAEIDLQIAAERDANARDTPCLFCAPVDCRVGGLMEIILGKPKK